MRARKTLFPEDQDPTIEVTPLIDIVFILLIFLLVTTSFVKETGIQVRRPGAASAVRSERGSLLVGLRADGSVWIAGNEVDLRAVRSRIERLHAESPQAGVVVVADRETRTGTLVQVMDQARLAGVQDVSVAARAEPR